MPEFILNKLGRDKIPELMRSAGQAPVVRTLEGRAKQLAQLEKIKEEVDEAIKAIDGSEASFQGEIADVQEAVDALCRSRGITREALKTTQEAARAKKGGFDEGYFIESVAVPEGTEWAQYYRNEPGRFTEVVASLEAVDTPSLAKGMYEHYKGGKYDVLGLACHTETNELFVVYKPLDEHDSQADIWIRPYEMFIEEVIVESVNVPRFRKV